MTAATWTGRLLAAGCVALALAAAAPAAAAETRVTAAAAYIGGWGLEVSIGRDCSAAVDQLDLTAGSGPLDGLYEACLEVTAEGVAVAAAGATLRCGLAVTLGEGFSVPEGSDFVVELEPAMSTDFASILDPSPIDESAYHAVFYLDRDGLSLGGGDRIRHFAGYTSGGVSVFSLILEPGAGGDVLILEARQDGGGLIQTAPGQEIALPLAWTRLELSWTAADGTGELLVSVDDGPFGGLTALDNDGYRIESVRWGAIDGSVGASAGLLRLDGFDSWR